MGTYNFVVAKPWFLIFGLPAALLRRFSFAANCHRVL
jgi:hypothetical protein